jgi:hypothetical protein
MKGKGDQKYDEKRSPRIPTTIHSIRRTARNNLPHRVFDHHVRDDLKEMKKDV